MYDSTPTPSLPERGSRRGVALAVGLALAAWLPAARAQDGLLGEYYDDPDLTVFVESRIDDAVDFTDWVGAPTGTSVTPDESYSERWSGSVLLDQQGSWTFRTVSNDGVRLTLDGVEVISNWNQHSAQTDSVVLPLAAGWHPLVLEHFQSGGSVTIQLLFEGPGQPVAIIPGDHLTPTSMTVLFPTVDPGPDKVLVAPDDSVQIHSVVADADGFVVDIQWSQVGGLPVTLGVTDQPDLDVSGITVAGDYVFEVTVLCDEGHSTTASITVTLSDCTPPGPIRIWERWSVGIPGPATSETADPNPFLDYRVIVTFQHGDTGQTRLVPGYYDADGSPALTGATSGSMWRADFTPDLTGGWVYSVSFRAGPDIALSTDPFAGVPLPADGLTGCIQVQPAAPDATGFHATGRLVTQGGHFLKFEGSGQSFLQGGANSPENLLAYADFDQTPPTHDFVEHLGDWSSGDPQWNGRGKGLIGAVNYLAAQGMNTVWFLTFNVAGDGDDVWPWTSKTERLRYDCSKLAQWNVVFDHMDRLGIQMYVVTQETENDTGTPALDGGNLGIERSLYYRELIARFGHHLGVVWNLGEENTNLSWQLRAFHNYIRELDPYDHPIVVHTFPEFDSVVYTPLLASGTCDGASLSSQSLEEIHGKVLNWRTQSAATDKPWFVGTDEIGPGTVGLLPDAVDPEHDAPRHRALWGNLIGGGHGTQWYFGNIDDLMVDDWRTRENIWGQTRHALDFFHSYLPFERMAPDDSLVDAPGAWCLASPGRIYAVYLPSGGNTLLDLGPSTSAFTVSWYDPRNGGPLLGQTTVQGPGNVLLAAPTTAGPDDDWVALVRRTVVPPYPYRLDAAAEMGPVPP